MFASKFVADHRIYLLNFSRRRVLLSRSTFFGVILLGVASPDQVAGQSHAYPKEIRGYKVERTVVQIKKPGATKKDSKSQRDREAGSDSDVDTLIQLGEPKLARVTPLGITFEVPVVVTPVRQSGHVEFLLFENMVVNGTSVEIDEYHRDFDLPGKEPLTLSDPLSFYVYLPRAALAAVDEWSDSKPTWLVTGRVYVFGKFKRGLFNFKRCVPIELNLVMRNPLKEN